MTRNTLILLSLLGMMAGAGVAFQFAGRPDTAPADDVAAQSAVQLTVATIQPERIVLSSEYSGRVLAGQRVEIRPQVGGLIVERPVEEGSKIAAGAVMFRIDPAPLKADLALAQAALARAQTLDAHARRAVERSDALLAKTAVSQQTNDAAHNDLLLAAAGVAEARAVVDRKRLDLDFATLRAPIGGYVAAGLADVGGLVTVGAETPMAVLQDLDTVTIDLRLPADDLDAVLMAAEQGLGPVTILKDHAAPLLGALKSSDVVVDPSTGYVSVRVEAANPNLALLPGMFVRASLPRGVLPDALLVPEEAILRTGAGGAQLAVVSREGTATRRDVVLGDRVGNRRIIASGLKAGEAVAIRGQNRVDAGATVSVLPSPAQAPLPNTQS